jgi:hypothetical protein
VFVYNEINYYLPSFIKLFHTPKRNKLLCGERISKFLRYADHDLPSLENKIQNLTGNVIDLEWKKKQSQDIIEILNSSILELRRTLNSYDMTIGVEETNLGRLRREDKSKVVLNENDSAMKQAHE